MSRIAGGGLVLLPEEQKQMEVGAFYVRYVASGSDSGNAFTLIETHEPTPSGGPPLHAHRDAAESFYVITGSYAMHLNGQDFECPAGSFIYIPAGMAHTFRSLTHGSRKLNLYTPAAMEGYFEELSAAIAAGVDEAAMEDIAERYQMDVLGPPPPDYLTPRS
jgi:mannose-6-phosphate isomerase-like protein (cupin superfamily)